MKNATASTTNARQRWIAVVVLISTSSHLVEWRRVVFAIWR
jgi:hypothetical protein